MFVESTADVELCLPWLIIMLICVVDMRHDVQEIFRMTPHEKQVMMFSATLSKDVRPVCKKFMQDVREPRPPALSG